MVISIDINNYTSANCLLHCYSMHTWMCNAYLHPIFVQDDEGKTQLLHDCNGEHHHVQKQQNSTVAEIQKLRGEEKALQSLYQTWSGTKASLQAKETNNSNTQGKTDNRERASSCCQEECRARYKTRSVCSDFTGWVLYLKRRCNIRANKKTSETSRKQALRLQLKFRKVVLKQTFPDKSVFQYSNRGKQLTSGELLQNLCKLMDASPCPAESEILADPNLLVGTRIAHRFEDEEGCLTWYEGLVVAKAPDSDLFEVMYFGEEEISEFELLQDFHTNDLKCIS